MSEKAGEIISIIITISIIIIIIIIITVTIMVGGALQGSGLLPPAGLGALPAPAGLGALPALPGGGGWALPALPPVLPMDGGTRSPYTGLNVAQIGATLAP